MENMTAEIGTPSGWWAKVSGMDTKLVLVVIIMLVMAVFAAFQWYEDRISNKEWRRQSIERDNITQSMLSTLITLTNKASADNAANINEMTFVMTLSQEKREALKLEMPQSLRRKLNETK